MFDLHFALRYMDPKRRHGEDDEADPKVVGGDAEEKDELRSSVN